MRDWIQLRTLFNCHTGLQKLSKEERSGAGEGERTAAEAEAHQMLTMLEAAAAQSANGGGAAAAAAAAAEEAAVPPSMPTAELTGAAGLVATVLCHLVAVRAIISLSFRLNMRTYCTSYPSHSDAIFVH